MVSTSFVSLLFLVCLQTVLLSTVSNCAKTISMYWNTTNSIFRIDNTDHIIDVNKNNAAFEFDQVNIICPVYTRDTYDDDAEKYIIYNVSKEEYETCRITNPSPRLIAICDKPFKTMYFTITFRPFTPQPGGLEFLPGHDYYFISTSSKDDLHRRIGGRCTSHNMKVVFKVCCNDADTSSSSSSSSSTVRNNSGSVASSTVASSSSTITTVLGSAGIPAQAPPSTYKGQDRFYPGGNVHHHHDHHEAAVPAPTMHIPPAAAVPYPGYPQHPQQPAVYNAPPSSISPKTSVPQKKKNKEYSDHPNEVVKNEELTYNGTGACNWQSQMKVLLLTLTASALFNQLLR